MALSTDLLPSPFYRVAVKALIFDEQQRLLVLQNDAGNWELPGGGLEHGESIAACIRRELQEEIGIVPATISAIQFVFEGVSSRGWHVLRLVVRATLPHKIFKPGDTLIKARFVTAEELADLRMANGDVGIQKLIDLVWHVE
jgi:8-oxo-dGTP pyrophosphatase MutT (NUDIX family)